MEITIWHNPGCGTSRKVLDAIRAAGHVPTVIAYLKTGWQRDELAALIAAAGLKPRDALRQRSLPAGLDLATADDAAILDAMVAYPVLVERPFVRTRKGVALCRPPALLDTLL